MTTAIILLLDLLNVFLLFRFILGCEFRKTRSSIVIGAGIVVATFVARVFYFDMLSYNVLLFFELIIAVLPAIFFQGKRLNLVSTGIVYLAITMPIIYLIQGLMMVILKSKVNFDDFDWYSISGEIVTTVIFCLLIAFFHDKKDRIHEEIGRAHV